MNDPKRATFRYLLRVPGLVASVAGAQILDEGRKFGMTAERVTGVRLRQWALGVEHPAGWAYRAALVVAVRHGYKPKTDDEINATARTMRAGKLFGAEEALGWWVEDMALWERLRAIAEALPPEKSERMFNK